MDIDSRLAELGILRIDTIVDAVPRSRGARSNPPANRKSPREGPTGRSRKNYTLLEDCSCYESLSLPYPKE